MNTERAIKYIDPLNAESADFRALLAAQFAAGPLTGDSAKFEPDRADVTAVLSFLQRVAAFVVPA